MKVCARRLRAYDQDDENPAERWADFQDSVGDGVTFKCRGMIQVLKNRDDSEPGSVTYNPRPIDNATVLAFLQQKMMFAR